MNGLDIRIELTDIVDIIQSDGTRDVFIGTLLRC